MNPLLLLSLLLVPLPISFLAWSFLSVDRKSQQAVRELLLPVPGFDRLTIDTIIAETGADMSRFPSPAHLAKWAGVCPGNHESAGKRRR